MHPDDNPIKVIPDLFDWHCHIHSADYRLDSAEELKAARCKGLVGAVCAGEDADDSRRAITLAAAEADVWATVGLHPHFAGRWEREEPTLRQLIKEPKVVAVGECGLDYYHSKTPRPTQITALLGQLTLAEEFSKPVVLHVRGSRLDPSDAFSDLFTLLDRYPEISGGVHCFTAGSWELGEILARGLSVGLSGIVTFIHPAKLIGVIRKIPLSSLLLESDAPLLTPVPYRGKINSPQYLAETAAAVARIREEPVELVAKSTAENARRLLLN